MHHHYHHSSMSITEYPSSREAALALGVNKYHGHPCVQCGETLRRVKQYDCYTCHKESRKRHHKEYRKTPKGASYRKASRLAYKQRLVTQCPPWADLKAIRRFYADAKGMGLEVDHVIPLKSELVCGLHVHTNLQLLTAEANIEKRNTFVVE